MPSNEGSGKHGTYTFHGGWGEATLFDLALSQVLLVEGKSQPGEGAQ